MPPWGCFSFPSPRCGRIGKLGRQPGVILTPRTARREPRPNWVGAARASCRQFDDGRGLVARQGKKLPLDRLKPINARRPSIGTDQPVSNPLLVMSTATPTPSWVGVLTVAIAE